MSLSGVSQRILIGRDSDAETATAKLEPDVAAAVRWLRVGRAPIVSGDAQQLRVL